MLIIVKSYQKFDDISNTNTFQLRRTNLGLIRGAPDPESFSLKPLKPTRKRQFCKQKMGGKQEKF